MNVKNFGQSIIEFIIAIALTAIFLPALITGLVASREGKAQQLQRLDATALLKEVHEAIRVVRENNWSSILENGTYHPVDSDTTWSLASGSEEINGFTRKIVIGDVYRDANYNIVEQGGSLDPRTKKATATVSWNTPVSYLITSTVYLGRFLSNSVFTQTSDSDFNQGINNGTLVTNQSGGEVVLAAGGHGNWCEPNLSIAAINLPKQGVANAISAIEGQVVAGTGENASGVSFAKASISNPSYPTPPGGTIAATFDGYKTNDVYGESGYAYLATDNNSKEIVIIDLNQIANGKFVETGYFNTSDNDDGNSVTTSRNIGFAAVEDDLFTFDLSSKTGARPMLDEIELAGDGNKVVINGNYAYVAVGNSNKQLQIIEYSPDGRNMNIVGYASVNGAAGKDVYVNTSGTRAYLATASSASQKEFFIIDISSKTGNRPAIGSYETNGMNPKEVTVVPGNKAIIVGSGAEEYQVIDITTESNFNLPRCGGLNIDSGVNGVSSVVESDGDAYSYIITGDDNAELKIIEGGPGGQFTSAGTFITNTFDPGAEVVYNRLYSTVNQPGSTNIKFQIGIADPVNNSCTDVNFTYIGPDKTASTYFTADSAIPFDNNGTDFENPGRCLSVKLYLNTTDITRSPTLYDITVNYSP